MVRLGLICRHDGYWGFSSRFEKAMEKLIEHLNSLKATPEIDGENMEFINIETAKGQKIHYQLRKKRKKEADNQ